MNKEDQLKEISDIITKTCENRRCVSSVRIAEALYKAGYRKQSEGEWVKDAPHWRYHCNQCGYFPLMLHGDFFPFCPNCGAKMRKEDEE